MAGTETPKRTVQRSPNFPVMDFGEALKRVRLVYEKDRRNYTSGAVILSHIGYEKLTGPAGRALSALQQYGLLDKQDGSYRVSDAAYKIIVLSDSAPDRQAAIKACALKPALFRELLNAYKEGLPSDPTLRDYLVSKKHFNPDSVGNFIRIFRKTIELAKGDSGVYMAPGNVENEEPQLTPEERNTQGADGVQTAAKSKTFNVPLDPLASESPQFAQVLVPVPLRDEQKKRLMAFIESL